MCRVLFPALFAFALLLHPGLARAEFVAGDDHPATPQQPPTAGPPARRVGARIELDLGAISLMDRGSVDQALVAAGFAPLPSVFFRFGCRLGFEIERVYLGAEVDDVQGSSATSGLRTDQIMLDLGYRIAGTPGSWGIIPIVGLGAGDTHLGFGAPSSATTFSQALRGHGPTNLDATSFLVHSGVLVDVLVLRDERGNHDLAIGLSTGLVAAPVSTGWTITDVLGESTNRSSLLGGPRVPGTGLYGSFQVTLAF